MSATDLSSTFGGTPGGWEIGLSVEVASTGARRKRDVKRPFLPPKLGSGKPFYKKTTLCLLLLCLDLVSSLNSAREEG